MSAYIDLRGRRFGRLTAISEAEPHIQPNKMRRTMWLCQCDCGNQVIMYAANLTNGHTLSCGCLQKERAKECATTHGKSKTRLHRTWAHMLERCRNPNVRNYNDYGGRGISVCTEWLDFQTFYLWAIKNGYSSETTIDRIDNNGNYCPKNCRFTDAITQCNNKRSNRLITANGKTLTLTQWSRELNIHYATLMARLNRGWDGESAINTPLKKVNFNASANK